MGTRPWSLISFTPNLRNYSRKSSTRRGWRLVRNIRFESLEASLVCLLSTRPVQSRTPHFLRHCSRGTLLTSCTPHPHHPVWIYGTGCEVATIFFVANHTKELLLFAEGKWFRVPMSASIAGACAESGEVINVMDVYKDPRFNG